VHARHERLAAEVPLELEHVLRERLRGLGATPERAHRGLVAARGAAEAEVDATWVQRLERAELLGDRQRRVVGQHAMSTAVADDAIASMLWCSAYHTRW
jgi:hypothetical protein